MDIANDLCARIYEKQLISFRSASPSVETTSIPVLDNDSDELQDVAECVATGGSSPYTMQWYVKYSIPGKPTRTGLKSCSS